MLKRNVNITKSVLVITFIFVVIFAFHKIVIASEYSHFYSWSVSMGDESGGGRGRKIAVDNNGNSYIAGKFSGTINFDPTNSVDNHTSNGGNDIFITKILNDGSYGWTYTIGAEGEDYAHGIDTNSSGDVYIGGKFSSTVDFDPTDGTDNKISNGERDAFLLKINSDSSYAWTYTIGGSAHDDLNHVEIDNSGNIFYTGIFTGSGIDLDPTGNTDLHDSNGSSDIYLTKINSDATYGWTYAIGGILADDGQDIDIDNNGNIYLAGNFKGEVDFDPGISEDMRDIALGGFVTKINSDGSYSWTYASEGRGSGISVAVDSKGNVYRGVGFLGTYDFDPTANVDQHTCTSEDILITKLDTSGTYRWTMLWGGSGTDSPYTLSTDNNDNLYLSGNFISNDIDFDPTDGVDNHASNGGNDIYLTRINSDATYGWTYTTGGNISDMTYASDIHDSNIYITGNFGGTLSPVDLDPTNSEDMKSGSIFLTKYSYVSIDDIDDIRENPLPVTGSGLFYNLLMLYFMIF